MNKVSLSFVFLGLILLLSVSIMKPKVINAQPTEEIFSSNSRSCSEDTSIYDRQYGTKPILLTVEELRTDVYPLGKQAGGTQRHNYCARISASRCGDYYYCWPDREKIERAKQAAKIANSGDVFSSGDSGNKTPVSEACRRNPQSYTCKYGHEQITSQNQTSTTPLKGKIENVELEKEDKRFTWKDWCADWQKKFDIVRNEIREIRHESTDYYSCEIKLTIRPDGSYKPDPRGKLHYHTYSSDSQRNSNLCFSILNRYLKDPSLRPLAFPPSYKKDWQLTMVFERATRQAYSKPCKPPVDATQDLN